MSTADKLLVCEYCVYYRWIQGSEAISTPWIQNDELGQ